MHERQAAVTEARTRIPESLLLEQSKGRVHHSLSERLRNGTGTQIIAEMKQASPSAGRLRTDYDPAAIGRSYTDQGACGISILTEPLHFLGSAEHIHAVRQVTSLPILRKDFMCDPYQILEAAAWGADVILLIVAALDDVQMQELAAAAREMGLEVLVESHTEDELERAVRIEDGILGINSRNLKTLKTDLATARSLSAKIPSNRLSIAESGIRERPEIEGLEALGYNGFLIGEALVREKDPGGRLSELLGRA